MTCNTCMDRILSLDNGERIPFSVALHLSRCPDCMKTADALNAAFSCMHRGVEGYDADISDAVMASVEQTCPKEKRKEGVSLRTWVLVGLVILAVMSFSAFAEPFISARVSTGDLFIMPVSLVFGIILSVYIVFFIVSNMAWITRLGKLVGLVPR